MGFQVLDSTGKIKVTTLNPTGVHEFGRSAVLGAFTAFTPTLTASAGTWTVGGGSLDCAYALIGPTLAVLSLDFENTSLSSTPDTLTLTLPFTAGRTTNVVIGAFMSGWDTDCLLQFTAASASATIVRQAGATFPSGAGLYVRSICLAVTQ